MVKVHPSVQGVGQAVVEQVPLKMLVEILLYLLQVVAGLVQMKSHYWLVEAVQVSAWVEEVEVIESLMLEVVEPVMATVEELLVAS